jgi:hypothetical protein
MINSLVYRYDDVSLFLFIQERKHTNTRQVTLHFDIHTVSLLYKVYVDINSTTVVDVIMTDKIVI